MRGAALCLTLAGIAALFVGCAAHSHGPDAATASSPELVSRLGAAAAITDSATRDHALAKVAWLGAQASDVRIVLNSLGAMGDSPVRDQAAYQCSGQLAENGSVPQAVAVTRMINDSTVRDRALSRIAQSNPYPVEPQ